MEAAIKLELANKTALVCGASQGIGAATAHELAELGCQVIALARSEDKLNKVVASLPGSGHLALVADLSDREALAQKVEATLSSTGTIHILINNTAGPKPGPISEADEENFLNGFQNHILVGALLTRLLLPGMKEANYGRIINIISTSVKQPIPNLGVSNTIRGAMASWCKTLSLEVAPFGITANNVLPGYTSTPRLASLIENAAKRQDKTIEQVTEEWRGKVPARRFADPAEVAGAAAFLASPAGSYINGINLPVDGGRTGSL